MTMTKANGTTGTHPADSARQVDPYKLADQQATIFRKLPLVSFPRIVEVLGESDGLVDVEMQFSRDEQRRCIVQGHLQTQAEVVCERCLNPVKQPVVSDFTLCVVVSDEAARDIPKEYDPLIVEGQALDIGDMVEEEILLALPMFSYHDDPQCGVGMTPAAPEPRDEGLENKVQKPNPFEVLSTLKLKK